MLVKAYAALITIAEITEAISNSANVNPSEESLLLLLSNLFLIFFKINMTLVFNAPTK